MKRYLVWVIWAVGMGWIVSVVLPKIKAQVSANLPASATSSSYNRYLTYGVMGAVIAGGAWVLREGLRAAKLKVA